MITKVLIANRGEIALRIMRTCRDMGIATVAVYSEADRLLPFVSYADEAYCIGPAPSTESYLRVDKILEVARQSEADGIHPGYGFLSEKRELAEGCASMGIAFIGPDVHAIEVMGNKITAKEAVKGFKTPLVPGSEGAVENVEEALLISNKIGFPVLVKAAAGGGGKGMRVVNHPGEFAEQMALAQSEAGSAFGDSSVFIEKYVLNPKHIEVQILADRHGNTVHLFERECSVQRRHQKVLEEAPSPVVDDDLRARLGEAAIGVARSVDYVGAGTVEFIMGQDKQFYFLEMNTRLQVEHPVTEMITGIDLVREQINIASGLPISFKQNDLRINGHAVEARIYAENPLENFLPSPALLERYQAPQGPGIRVDDGFAQGLDIPVYYDPMIAKLIAHGRTREEAIKRLDRALQEYDIAGPEHNIAFLRFCLLHNEFTSGRFDTGFIEKFFTVEQLESKKPTDDQHAVAAALAAFAAQQTGSEVSAPPVASSAPAQSLWQIMRR